jgi:hypothetical protein
MVVSGTNMEGVFTHPLQPKMAAHVLREFWVKGADAAREREEDKPANTLEHAAITLVGRCFAGSSASRPGVS